MDTFQKVINIQALLIHSVTYPDLGCIGQVITNQEFLGINNDAAFIAPAILGIAPMHQQGARAVQIVENIRRHELFENEFNIFNHTRTQLRNIIINNVEDTLSNDVISYNQVSTLTFLTYLWDTFFKLYAFILLTSTLVPGINYFVVTTHPLHYGQFQGFQHDYNWNGRYSGSS